MNKCEEVMPRS